MRRERVLGTAARKGGEIPAYAGMTKARKRRIPPLPIRGEDAANAAGEGTGDDSPKAGGIPA